MKMRNVLRVWKFLVVGVSLGMTILWVTPVDATPLSNTPISWSTFISFANIEKPVVPPLIDYFDFNPPTDGFDGEIYSAVFEGSGAAAGKFVYVYQVYHYSTSSAGAFTGIAFRAFTTKFPVNVSGVGTSFYITPPADPEKNPPPTGIGTTANSWGDRKPTAISWIPVPKDLSSDVSLAYISLNIPPAIIIEDQILPGEAGFFFGFVHSLPPTWVKSNPKNGGEDLLSPLVYTPSPEPSAFILLSAGLLGLMAIRRRYLS